MKITFFPLLTKKKNSSWAIIPGLKQISQFVMFKQVRWYSILLFLLLSCTSDANPCLYWIKELHLYFIYMSQLNTLLDLPFTIAAGTWIEFPQYLSCLLRGFLKSGLVYQVEINLNGYSFKLWISSITEYCYLLPFCRMCLLRQYRILD